MDDEFRNSFRFCMRCGGPLRETSSLPVRFTCDQCGRTTFLNAKVGVSLLIENNGALLLVKRAEEPYKDWWVLPSGYVEYEESCEQAAVREASEELSTKVELQDLQGVYSYGDDPRSRMVLVVYRATCDARFVSAGDDAAECRFFLPNDLPSTIAFDGVRQAIAEWLKGQGR